MDYSLFLGLASHITTTGFSDPAKPLCPLEKVTLAGTGVVTVPRPGSVKPGPYSFVMVSCAMGLRFGSFRS